MTDMNLLFGSVVNFNAFRECMYFGKGVATNALSRSAIENCKKKNI